MQVLNKLPQQVEHHKFDTKDASLEKEREVGIKRHLHVYTAIIRTAIVVPTSYLDLTHAFLP